MFQSVRTYRTDGRNDFTAAPCTYVRSVLPRTPLYRKSTDQQSLYFGHKSSQVKFANYLTDGRNSFTESCFSEQKSQCAETCGITRFETKLRGTEKTVGVTCEQDIITAILSGFDGNRIFHEAAKLIRRRAYRLRFFII